MLVTHSDYSVRKLRSSGSSSCSSNGHRIYRANKCFAEYMCVLCFSSVLFFPIKHICTVVRIYPLQSFVLCMPYTHTHTLSLSLFRFRFPINVLCTCARSCAVVSIPHAVLSYTKQENVFACMHVTVIDVSACVFFTVLCLSLFRHILKVK